MFTQRINSYEQLNDLSGGWIPVPDVITFVSADSPSYLVSVGYNATGTYGLGMKLQLNHQSQLKNFFITQITLTGTTTYMNLYGGTDYTLNVTGAITSPNISYAKSPSQFPTNPDKWTVSLINTSNASQATPTNITYYNVGNLSIDVPIGVWTLKYSWTAGIMVTTTALRNVGIVSALSTINNAVSDNEFRMSQQLTGPTGANNILLIATREKIISLTSKTSYYLLVLGSVATDAITSIAIRGDLNTTAVRAVCAYL